MTTNARTVPIPDGALDEALSITTYVVKAIAKRRSKGLPCAADELPAIRKLTALMEEVGEVARVIQEHQGSERLRSELRDVAVCALLWAGTVTDEDAT